PIVSIAPCHSQLRTLERRHLPLSLSASRCWTRALANRAAGRKDVRKRGRRISDPNAWTELFPRSAPAQRNCRCGLRRRCRPEWKARHHDTKTSRQEARPPIAQLRSSLGISRIESFAFRAALAKALFLMTNAIEATSRPIFHRSEPTPSPSLHQSTLA